MTLRASLRTQVLWLVMLFVAVPATGVAQQGADGNGAAQAYTISGIQTETAGEEDALRITGSASPTFTTYELFDPLRIVIDIADASFAETANLPLETGEGPVTRVTGRVVDEKEPSIGRIELFLAEDLEYSVTRDQQDIVVSFSESVPMLAENRKSTAEAGQEGGGNGQAEGDEQDSEAEAETTGVMAIDDGEVSTEPMPEAEAREMAAEFSGTGYTERAITFDFFNIDLRNVFRLFGEISGYNIVIDEAVGGTLTLSLKNVPWDFALDLILNLKGLEAHQRFNTMVISRKGKDFVWPERRGEGIAIEGEAEAEAESFETLAVKQKLETPPEVVEAKKLMRAARQSEKAGDYASALQLYERAFEKWPKNADLAKRLASLFLVQEGMNAKAVRYGKAALKVEQDANAALYTAIGLANMKRNRAAREYFESAVQGEKPPGEALVSYAIFNEERGDYVNALLLLSRHESLYGDTLDTMIARARIYDKEGNSEKAAAEYRAILLSGYDLPPDLRRYIKGRLAMDSTKNK